MQTDFFVNEETGWDFRTADTKELTHCFHVYPAMMIPQVARRLIHRYGNPGGVLLDPFCGSGTALVEAKVFGMNAIGIDINPLARHLGQVKTHALDPHLLRRQLSKILSIHHKKQQLAFAGERPDVPDFFNINYWFSEQAIHDLQLLKDSILSVTEEEALRDFFLVPFSETVREASYTRNSEFKLFRLPKEKLNGHQPNVGQIFHQKARRNIAGMAQFLAIAPKDVWVRILDEDTRHRTSIADNQVDLVVTSPPYGDSHTTVAYGQFSRLSLQWLGYDHRIGQMVDRKSLGGKAGLEDGASELSPTLARTLDRIAESDPKRANQVLSFFVDFGLCLQELARVTKCGAKICMVVGNRTVKGQRILLDQILVEMGARRGLGHQETFYRNIPNKRMPSLNSPTNVVGAKSQTMTQESIVILTNSKKENAPVLKKALSADSS